MNLTRNKRIPSIDILRGMVMVIMALDHTREFFHETALTSDPLDPASTSPVLFFTRWITHFCAPVFVFLSGISAFLSARKRSRQEAGNFLVKRGLWLVVVELVLVTLGITFNPYYEVFILQVIWAIGWSMVLLGIAIRVSDKLVLAMGILFFFGHNITDLLHLPRPGEGSYALTLLLKANGNMLPVGDSRSFLALYAILPWSGVMMMGYSVGKWFTPELSATARRKRLVAAGAGLITIFLALRFTNWYGNPTPYQPGNDFMSSLYAFLNTSKYPPSLLYLSMTLGPALLLLALLENARATWTTVVSVYGKVPFFYYILHFYLLHFLVLFVYLVNQAITGSPGEHTFIWFRPLTFGYNLWIVYGIWMAVVIFLYFPCRWYSRYKQSHAQWWLSYA